MSSEHRDDAAPIELLSGYDRWRKNQANKDPDVSPQGYLRFRQSEALFDAIADVEASDWAVQGLAAALKRDDLDEALIATLRDALTVCTAVRDAA